MKDKKTVFIVIAVLTALTLTTLIASAIVIVSDVENPDDYLGTDLTSQATEITASINPSTAKFVVDGNVNTFWQGERRGSYLQFYFESGIEFNTVVINETGMSVSAFEIYVSEDGSHYEKVYEQDRIQRGRLCALTESIGAKYVHIRIKDSDASPRINDVSIYNAERGAENFSVNARLSFDDIMRGADAWSDGSSQLSAEEAASLLDIEKLNAFDRVIIDARATWKGDGIVIDGRVADNVTDMSFTMRNFRYALDLLRQSLTDTQIILSFKAYDDASLDQGAAAVAENIAKFIADCGLDGAEIDVTSASDGECVKYAQVVKALAELLGKQTYVSLAATTGQVKYFSNAAESLSALNVAGFTGLDQNGDSAGFFASCVQTAYMCIDYGFAAEKINIGAPLFGTYSQNPDERYPYSAVVGDYDRYDNVFECVWGDERVSDIRFNGTQLLYDKTCYAVCKGLGGITLWGAECDRKGIGEDTLSYAVFSALDGGEADV